ncbi:gamma-tubulin complex component 6-like isoform X2 [Sipha flava]|uniref:Gamma-tubulin complex component n=1 Tax=Sipha flava TaxID=143950 RepID=A0A8B8FST8_9HEMI|nr:gamma-tubulin complex component 6-like isoform X2 [Sipha flava]
MSTLMSSRNLNILNKDRNIPNIFTSQFNQQDGVLYPLNILEREKNIPNVFNFQRFDDKVSTHSCIYTDNEYPDLFTLNKSYSKQYILKNDLWEKYSNYTSVFSLSDIQHIDCIQNLEINNSDNVKQEKNNSISNDKLLQELSSEKENCIRIDNTEVNKSNTSEKSSISKENTEENISSAYCFWCIVTATNVRDHNIKTYFPQREINSGCIMKDIKLMLINMGTTYFFVDEETHMYKRNGNISINGLTPEMFESATDPILECSNLYKIICNTVTKWKEKSDDSIVKAFIFAMSNIMNDYEQTIYAVSNESMLSLVGRVSNIIPRLQLLANICGMNNPNCIYIQDHEPSGVHLLNKIHNYLFEYRFSCDLFLRMLLYIFQSCCFAYLRILSNWALKGVLNNDESCIFIKLKPDIVDEDNNCRQNWDRFIIDESIEVPMFLDKYKKNILQCGKTINFFNKFNDVNVFLPDLTCCFDAIDTQNIYEQFSMFFKYDSDFQTSSSVKRMSNSYLFETADKLVNPKRNSDIDDIQNDNITNVKETMKLMYSDNENYELFQIPDWTSINNSYEFDKPYGFFLDLNDSLTYNDKPFDVINMIDYVPHSILIPARIQKSVCDKQILDMYFVQENLMGHLYFLSQCFFLMNCQFTSKLRETLFNDIATNRQNPVNIFNSIKLKSIVDEAIQDSFSENWQHGLTLENTFIPRLNGVIEISDIECLDLKYSPEWPMNMILPNKVLLKYKRIFLFANKLEYVSWSLFKARELLNVFKNDTD